MSLEPGTDVLPPGEGASAPSEAIRVLLADDHDILRDGLRALLEMAGDIAVVGEARTGREAVDEAERLRPHVVLMDITMPELDGVEACRRIRQQTPEVRVLFLTMHEAEEYFFRALRAGAAGYVIKRTAAADLLAAVRAVARGESFLSPGVARSLMTHYHTQERARHPGAPGAASMPGDRYATLTSREREVLQLVGEGHTNQEIADLLSLSIKTVQTHRAAVMEKLDLRDVTHLVRYAVRHGLVDPER
ncbi:MAG TPA: response regulator transcription factor [Ktedonobacterales bacterium]|jgi:DNA-binding NarL/FixJ family response regulator